MTKFLSKFRRDEKGVTLVEYGIALILAVSVGTAALTTLGTAVDGKMQGAEDCLTGTNTSC